MIIAPQTINEYFGISAPTEEFECPDLFTVANIINVGKVIEWEEDLLIKSSITTSLHDDMYTMCFKLNSYSILTVCNSSYKSFDICLSAEQEGKYWTSYR